MGDRLRRPQPVRLRNPTARPAPRSISRFGAPPPGNRGSGGLEGAFARPFWAEPRACRPDRQDSTKNQGLAGAGGVRISSGKRWHLNRPETIRPPLSLGSTGPLPPGGRRAFRSSANRDRPRASKPGGPQKKRRRVGRPPGDRAKLTQFSGVLTLSAASVGPSSAALERKDHPPLAPESVRGGG